MPITKGDIQMNTNTAIRNSMPADFDLITSGSTSGHYTAILLNNDVVFGANSVVNGAAKDLSAGGFVSGSLIKGD